MELDNKIVGCGKDKKYVVKKVAKNDDQKLQARILSDAGRTLEQTLRRLELFVKLNFLRTFIQFSELH